jgi:hypothetical protein
MDGPRDHSESQEDREYESAIRSGNSEAAMRYIDPNYDPQCAYCCSMRDRGASFYPPHAASDDCESGKRNHCSCDRCF